MTTGEGMTTADTVVDVVAFVVLGLLTLTLVYAVGYHRGRMSTLGDYRDKYKGLCREAKELRARVEQIIDPTVTIDNIDRQDES